VPKETIFGLVQRLKLPAQPAPPPPKVPWKVQPINFLGMPNLPPLFTKYENGTNIRVQKVGQSLDFNIILNLMGVFKMRKF
jgi:hypothetical protein